MSLVESCSGINYCFCFYFIPNNASYSANKAYYENRGPIPKNSLFFINFIAWSFTFFLFSLIYILFARSCNCRNVYFEYGSKYISPN